MDLYRCFHYLKCAKFISNPDLTELIFAVRSRVAEAILARMPIQANAQCLETYLSEQLKCDPHITL